MEKTPLDIPEPKFRGFFLKNEAFQKSNPLPVVITGLKVKAVTSKVTGRDFEVIDVFFKVPELNDEKEYSQSVFRDSAEYKDIAESVKKGFTSFMLEQEVDVEGKSKRKFSCFFK